MADQDFVPRAEGYMLGDWEKAEGVATSEGFIKPLIATKNVSVTALEIAPGDEVLPHNHRGLPYFEVVLYVVEGDLEIIFRDKRVPVKKGMAIMADPNEHGWVNSSHDPFSASVVAICRGVPRKGSQVSKSKMIGYSS